MTVYSKTFWETVRLAYEHSDETVAAVAQRFGIAKSTLLAHARNEDWMPRRERNSHTGKPRDLLIRRLYRTIDIKLAQLEARMHNDEDLSVADHERETRAIGQLIKNFEKVTDLETGGQDGSDRKRRFKSEHEAGVEKLDAHRIRSELAERILRLREKRNPNG